MAESSAVSGGHCRGAWLNPRIGKLDVKLLFETRFAWIMLFYITCSCAAHQFETNGGAVSLNMWFMVLAHFLYVNACMKVRTVAAGEWRVVCVSVCRVAATLGILLWTRKWLSDATTPLCAGAGAAPACSAFMVASSSSLLLLFAG